MGCINPVNSVMHFAWIMTLFMLMKMGPQDASSCVFTDNLLSMKVCCVPPPTGSETYCFWCGSCLHWHGTFLSVEYPVNQSLGSYKICMETFYSQPSLYWHTIQQQNSLQWQFECHNPLLTRWQLMRNYARICFGYLLESPHWGDSNKYPKHTFCQETRIKQGLSYVSLCLFRILYNSKFILVATSLEQLLSL